jgi:hypothetical protein
MSDYEHWRNTTGDVGDPSKYGKADLDRGFHKALKHLKIFKVKSHSEQKKFISDLFSASGQDCAACVYVLDAALKAKKEIGLDWAKGVLKNYFARSIKTPDSPTSEKPTADSPGVMTSDDKETLPAPSADRSGEPSGTVMTDNPQDEEIRNHILDIQTSFHSSLTQDPSAKGCPVCGGTGIELMIAGMPDRLIISGYKYHPCRKCHPSSDGPVGLTWPLSVTDEQVLWPMWPGTMDHEELCAQLEMVQSITEGDCKKQWKNNHAKRAKLERSRGFIYFIQAGNDGPIKIGWSEDVRSRLKQLKTANALPLKLLGSIEGTQEVEQFCHKLFSHLLVDGEWFNPDTSLLEMIGRICG